VKLRTTGILASFLAVLFVYVYFYELGSGSNQKGPSKIFDFDPEEVAFITLSKGAQKIVCKREGNDWVIRRPLTTRAESEVVREVISSLADAREEELIDRSPSDLAAFGLEKSKALEISIILNDENKAKRLLLGDELPVNRFYVYAKKGDHPTVFSTYAGLRAKSDKSLVDLRDKNLFVLTPQTVARLEIRSRGEAIICEKRGAKDWRITHPIKARADTQRIENILKEISNGKIREFVEDAPLDLAPYGLTQPQIKIVLDEKESERTRALEIGAAKGGMIYARNSELDSVFLIDKSILEHLPCQAADMRDLRPLVFDSEDIKEVELESAAGRMVLSRGNRERWEIVVPIQAKADEWKVKEMFRSLRTLIIKEFVSPSESLSRYGFDRPKIELTLWEKDIPHVFLVSEMKSSEGSLFAKSTHQDVPFVIDPEAIQNLLKAPLDFRDRHLIPFDSTKVTELELRYPHAVILCQKKGSYWRITKPIRAPADRIKIWGLLFALEDLRFSKMADTKDTNLSSFGPKDPQLTITLWDKTHTLVGRLALGQKRAEEVIYVRVHPDNTIYEVNLDLLERIPRDVSDLVYKR